jgi:beta-glucosidase
MNRVIFGLAAICGGLMLCGCTAKIEKVHAYKINPSANWAVTPVQRTEELCIKRHQAIIDRIQKGNVDLIFIGDSITHGWESAGENVWQQYYAKRNAVNMGLGGDQTQHALWRLQNGELAGISPKLAIVLIGINNSGGDTYTAKQIGEGIIKICQTLRHDLPQTKILILAIFPIDEKPSPRREKNAEASLLASTIADNKWIYYMDINDKFLDKDGTLSRDIMPDFLHPSAKGYQIEAEAIEPMVKKLMGEKGR